MLKTTQMQRGYFKDPSLCPVTICLPARNPFSSSLFLLLFVTTEQQHFTPHC